MFERALCLRAPQFVSGHFDFAETIGFLSKVRIALVRALGRCFLFPFTLCAVIFGPWPDCPFGPSFMRVLPVRAAKVEQDAHTDGTLVECSGKLIVLAHVIKLNALSPVYGHGDACVVSRSAPRLDIRVVELFPHHKRHIFFLPNIEGAFQRDAISISLCECRSSGCMLPSQFRSHSVRELEFMKCWSAKCDLAVESVLIIYAAESWIRMKVKISGTKRDPL